MRNLQIHYSPEMRCDQIADQEFGWWIEAAASIKPVDKTETTETTENMSTILKDESKSDWENPKVGMTAAICIDVVDLGVQSTEYGDKEQIKLVFQLDQERTDGAPMRIGRKYTKTLNDKGNFRKDLKSWRGADLTAEERAEFDADKLIGAQAQVLITEFQKTDGTPGTSIGAITPPADGQDVKADEEYVRVQDREDGVPF
tara:strand:+ start:815 stop:1417 length:603 start_codon:yes stop_codon:yes gene_type:complete